MFLKIPELLNNVIFQNMFLKIPELLNVIFQNSFEWLFLKTLQETKVCLKSTTKKAPVLLQLLLFGCLYH